MDFKILEKSVVVDDRSGKLDRPSPAGYSKDGLWSILVFSRVEGGAAAHDRSGKPEKTSWDDDATSCSSS